MIKHLFLILLILLINSGCKRQMSNAHNEKNGLVILGWVTDPNEPNLFHITTINVDLDEEYNLKNLKKSEHFKYYMNRIMNEYGYGDYIIQNQYSGELDNTKVCEIKFIK